MSDFSETTHKRIVRLPGTVLQNAAFIYQLRTTQKLKQEDVADIANVSQGTVSNVEKGTGKPLLETVVKLLWAMDCDFLLEVPEDVLLFIDEVKEDIQL